MSENTDKPLGPHEKALRINLDTRRYGTIAEIGAGQEVSAWFFRVGAASGTIAKTMSAYDMKFGDEIYGGSQRYVSKGRLIDMLDHEYGLLQERLGDQRGPESTFFAFADTVSARNYQGNNICHGWIGIRFQDKPLGPTNDILLHINLLDSTSLQQQQAVGVLGVNLIYAAFFHLNANEKLIASLIDDLSLKRVEIDSIDLKGPVFENLDPRWASLLLLKYNLGTAVVFPKDGNICSPMDLVYKSPVVIERGMFQDVDARHMEMLRRGYSVLKAECKDSRRDPVQLVEMTLRDVHGKDQDLSDIFKRMLELHKKKVDIMITVFPEYYHLTRLLNRYTNQPVRFVIGVVSILQLLSEKYYSRLSGGLVEAMGRLMSANVKIYVFAMDKEDFFESGAYQALGSNWTVSEQEKISLATLEPKDSSRHLFRYLLDVGALEALDP